MILARNSITLHHLRDITTVVWYYKLQASTASPPAKPTTETPTGWSTTEPSYTEGSTNSLYVVQKTTFSDGTFEYSDVSLSTSYEAAKAAYNKSVQAQTTANDAKDSIDNLEIGGRNLLLNTGGNDVAKVRTAIAQQSRSTALTNNMSTKTMSNGEIHFVTTTTTNERYYRFITPVRDNLWGIEPGKTYTISFYTKGTVGASNDIRYRSQYIDTSNWKTISDKTFTEKVGTNYQKVSFTETIPSNATAYYSSIQVYGDDTSNSDFYIKNLKFELGNKPTDWTPAPEDLQAGIDTLQPELIVGTHGTTATATWTGTSTVLTEIKAGTRIQYKLSSAGASNVTLNLTLKNGTTTGAKNVYFLNTTRLGTQYDVNAIVDLIYDGSAWRVLNPYTNSNTVGTYGGAVKAGANGVKNYSLVMRDTETTWVSLTTTAGTGTSKSRYTGKLYPDNVMYMGSNSAYASGATTGTCYEALGVNLQYSTNCGSTLTSGRAVYLVGTLDSDRLFTLDATWWTQTIPTTADGKTYIYLGLAYSTTSIYLVPENTLYQYFEGAFRALREIEEMKAAKVADNYLSADNTGIMVADMTDGNTYTPSTVPSGTKNTFIDEDSFQVRDGTDVLASFGETTQIGQDGTNHQIIDSTGLQGINEDGVTVFQIDMDGAVAETFVSSGKRLAFLRNIAGGQSKTVTVSLDDFPMINKRVILKVVTLFRTDQGGVIEQHNSIERFTYGTDAHLFKEYGATRYSVTYSATDNTLTLLVQVGDAPARQYTYVELNLMSYYTSAPAPAFLFGSRWDPDNLGAFSGTIGEALSASTRDQFACGRYNYEDMDYAFMVGNGDETNGDSNAFVATWDGDVLMALDEEATTGTDAELYSAITALGWESEVLV